MALSMFTFELLYITGNTTQMSTAERPLSVPPLNGPVLVAFNPASLSAAWLAGLVDAGMILWRNISCCAARLPAVKNRKDDFSLGAVGRVKFQTVSFTVPSKLP